MKMKYTKLYISKKVAIALCTAAVFSSSLTFPVYAETTSERLAHAIESDGFTASSSVAASSSTLEDPAAGTLTEEELAELGYKDEKGNLPFGVMTAQLCYVFDDASYDIWGEGTAFLIGDRYAVTAKGIGDTGTTNSNVVELVNAKKELYSRIGISLDENNAVNHLELKLIDDGGNVKKINEYIKKDNLVVCVLADAEDDKRSYDIADSTNLTDNQEIYVDASDNDGNGLCSITETSGNIKIAEDGSYSVTLKTEELLPVGAPIINGKGDVLGVITGKSDSYTIMPSKNVRAALDEVKVDYRTDEERYNSILQQYENDQAEEEAEKSKREESRENLKKTLDKASKIEKELYTSESYGNFQKKYNAGEKIYKKNTASIDEMDRAEKALADSMKGLEEKSSIAKKLDMFGLGGLYENHGIKILAYPIIVILGVIAIFKIEKKKGKKNRNKKNKKENNKNINEEGFIQADGREDDEYEEYGNGDTSLLDDGSGDTGIVMQNALLIRKDTGEKIPIREERFSIGKMKNAVSYRILNNNTVSRTHCYIFQKNGMYYLEDAGSSNGTFLNGKRLEEGVSMQLQDKDVIRISDVELIFQMDL